MPGPRRTRAVISAGLAAVVATVGFVTATGGPVGAESTSTSCQGVPGKAFGSWSNQCAMVNDTNAADRQTWVVDPGAGNFLSRDQLLSYADDYAQFGFGRQFLWYAPMTRLRPPTGDQWSACLQTRPVGDFCGNVNTHPQKTLGDDLTQDDTLDVIAWQGNWIALACGNFHLPAPVAGATPPTPIIRGFKFNDANRDGLQDNGETGLAGITFTLSRVSSLVGQPNAADIASTTSDAEGNFSFALSNDEGPGTYVVTEQFDSDWPNTTLLSQSVDVPEGAGDGENLRLLTFGDRQEIPPVPVAASQEADQDSPDGARITLDGSGSYSPTGDPLSYHWTWPGGSADGANPPVVMPPGVTTVILTVSDGIMSRSTTTTVTVWPPVSATPVSVSAVEGNSFTAPVATFIDPDPAGSASDYLATVDWGDGTPASSGDITEAGGTFTVTGQHTYAEEGSYPVTVTITDEDVPYNTDTAGGTSTVTDALLHATSLDFVSTNPVDRVLATFTDDNPGGPLSDFSATIDWGDGTAASSGVVAGPTGGPFSVSGSHAYATLGHKTITIHIVDVGGSTATAIDHAILYAPSGFVIGDLNSAIGSQVTYWGSQWWKLNDLSGGTAPAAFKGYQGSTGGDTAATNWTSRPGNSSGPPASVPTFMSVIVTSQVSQDGSTISGNAPHIVIVQTDPGYAADPGHAGSGTVVAQVR